MFRYFHPVRTFGQRGNVAQTSGAISDDLKFFIGAYIVGTAFVLTYLA